MHICAEDTFNRMKKLGIKVSFLQLNNAGKNQKQLERVCTRFGVTLEYVSPNTPQHNSVVERQFATDIAAIRAMGRAAKLSKPLQNRLWAEAANTQCYLRSLAVTGNRTKPSHTLFYGKDPDQRRRLIEFGRIGYVANRNKIKAKLQDRARKGLMVGYALDHKHDSYRMYMPDTRRVVISRDIQWSDWKSSKASDGLEIDEESDDNENLDSESSRSAKATKIRSQHRNRSNKGNEPEPIKRVTIDTNARVPRTTSQGISQQPLTSSSTKANQELRRLDAYYNPTTPSNSPPMPTAMNQGNDDENNENSNQDQGKLTEILEYKSGEEEETHFIDMHYDFEIEYKDSTIEERPEMH